MVGRSPSVSDAEILRAIALVPDPVVTAGDLVDALDMTRQGVYSRLNNLEDDGYLRSKKVGGAARVYWLTHAGRKLAADA